MNRFYFDKGQIRVFDDGHRIYTRKQETRVTKIQRHFEWAGFLILKSSNLRNFKILRFIPREQS